MRTVLRGCTMIGDTEKTTIVVEDGSIITIGDDYHADGALHLGGLAAAPGLIDLQINGAYGHDFTSDPGSIWQVGELLPRHGVTSFLPTIVTSPPQAIEGALEALRARPHDYRGAEPLGLHFEGPMLSPHGAGVHDVSMMQLPNESLVDGWSAERGVAMVTMAPELEGAEAVVKRLTEAGVVVSAGHSAADYDQARAAFAWGVAAVTHLFNAMPPLHHRAPGLPGAALLDANVVAGLIVDGVHVHPAVVSAVWRILGSERLALVSDAVAPAGLGPGSYRLGRTALEVDGGRCTDEGGRLAGSTLTLDQAVRNLIDFCGCSAEEAVAAASSTPARLLGLEDRGRLAEGCRADLVLFDDAMQVQATIVGGKVVFGP